MVGNGRSWVSSIGTARAVSWPIALRDGGPAGRAHLPKVSLFRGEGCWLVECGDRILLATYAVLSCAQSDADECHKKAVDDGWDGIVVVGPPGLRLVARVPYAAAETGITVEFVDVDLGSANSTGGRAA